MLKVINEYEVGLKFRRGKFVSLVGPGLNIYIPFFEFIHVVDTRIRTLDIPQQEAMTKDNIPLYINAVVYFRIKNAEKAILSVKNFYNAVLQYSQTALRDVIGLYELDFILSEREEIANEIKRIVDEETDKWGIEVTSIKIQDLEMPSNMKRAMARQAEAEREKRGTIILAKGEFQAAQNLIQAAENLATTPYGLHIRTLQTISKMSPDKSSTKLYVIPDDLIKIVEAFKSKK